MLHWKQSRISITFITNLNPLEDLRRPSIHPIIWICLWSEGRSNSCCLPFYLERSRSFPTKLKPHRNCRTAFQWTDRPWVGCWWASPRMSQSQQVRMIMSRVVEGIMLSISIADRVQPLVENNPVAAGFSRSIHHFEEYMGSKLVERGWSWFNRPIVLIRTFL
jgi:hypothetical protein